jgi:FG-GAP repeat
MPADGSDAHRSLLKGQELAAILCPHHAASGGQRLHGALVESAVPDVNGDGRPDLAVANYHGDAVSVLLGNGCNGHATDS